MAHFLPGTVTCTTTYQWAVSGASQLAPAAVWLHRFSRLRPLPRSAGRRLLLPEELGGRGGERGEWKMKRRERVAGYRTHI